MSTTRNQRKPKPFNSPCAPVAPKRIENSWILLLPDHLFENDNFSIITLPHPANGNPAKFSLNSKLKKIYEVVTFKEPYRSWFIGETVKSNGSIHLVTPVNPLFLVLPRLRELCRSRAMPLEDLLSEKGFEKIVDYVNNLDCIGDIKGSPDMKAYKYNEEKTLSWLEGKVRQLAGVLRSKNIHVTSAAASVTFVTSNICNQSVDEEFFLKYASGIISEYLESELIEQLEKRFDFKPDLIESVGKKRKSDTQQTMPNKKLKSETDEDIKHVLNDSNPSINDWKELKKQKPLTAKEKARQKAASGTKTISAFFSKK
ncbi:unnamed protein product [Diatraea saccharalis]|uniref:Ribonuclease H2 subunit B n=1 Tax=Diatraea saccharalis TaxID=40085 RepID=A0A9N9QTA2_9NEOP|nr:unnamed protein product [Diatraea saccharalis]